MSYDPVRVAEVVRESNGLMTVAAAKLGCAVSTVYRHRDKFEVVREALADSRASVLDLAEQRLFDAIEAGEQWAVLFTLKTLGASRGYVDRAWQVPLADSRVSRLTDAEINELIEREIAAERDKLIRSLSTEELQRLVEIGEAQGVID